MLAALSHAVLCRCCCNVYSMSFDSAKEQYVQVCAVRIHISQVWYTLHLRVHYERMRRYGLYTAMQGDKRGYCTLCTHATSTSNSDHTLQRTLQYTPYNSRLCCATTTALLQRAYISTAYTSTHLASEP
jgi:uncharacterized protein (DUF2126 family)